MTVVTCLVSLVVVLGQATPAPVTPSATASAAVPSEEVGPHAVPTPHPVTRDTGYRGQWHGFDRPHRLAPYRYSGGLATFPARHLPIAVYAEKARKTFFVYAGSVVEGVPGEDQPTFRAMVSYFDHETATVPRPTILLESPDPRAHGCPALAIDAEGRLWVFVALLGADGPGMIFRSTQPYDISGFEKVTEMPFASPQPWYVDGQGFILVHSRTVDAAPRLHVMTSRDGLAWSTPRPLVGFGEEHAFVSGRHKSKVGIAFTVRAPGLDDDDFTALYYIETRDFGRTWQALPNRKLEVPIASEKNDALVREYGTHRVFKLQDLNFDAMGNPVALYTLRHRPITAARADSRTWSTARWIGNGWEASGILRSDHDYDLGCLDVEKITWRLIFPYEPGPQPLSAGGDLVMWICTDMGRWWKPAPLMTGGEVNHNGVRRPMDAQPEFFALWADGHARKPSESHLYFMDKAANMYILPFKMTEDAQKPQLWRKAPETQEEEGEK